MPSAAIQPEVRTYCRTAGVRAKLNKAQVSALIDAAPESKEEVDAMIQLELNERPGAIVVPETRTGSAPVLSRELLTDIKTRGRLAGLDNAELDAIEIAATDKNHASTLILEAVSKRAKETGGAFGGAKSHVESGPDAIDKSLKYVEGCLARAMESEVCNSRPNTEARNADDRDDADKEAPDEFKRYLNEDFKGLDCRKQDSSDLARVWLNAMGIEHERMSGVECVRACFSKDATVRAEHKMFSRSGPIRLFRDNGSAAVSGTASFPFLLENIQTKALRRIYARWNPTWMKWCRKGSLPDFKKGSRIALSDAGDLLLTRENEVPKAANFSDEAEYIQLSKYSRRFSFTWETMLGDGLGGMARTTMGIARAVMRLPSKLLYADLMSNPAMSDGVNLFDSTHFNTQTGVMGATALNTMYTAMLNQKGKIAPQDGALNVGGVADNLDISPRGLIIPPNQWYAASKLLNPNQQVNLTADGGAGVGAPFWTGNVPGIPPLELVVEPRLANTDYTNYSVVKFFMYADPSAIDAYEVAFLDGSSEPIMVQRQDHQTFGWETVVVLPVAVKALEWRAMQYSTGA